MRRLNAILILLLTAIVAAPAQQAVVAFCTLDQTLDFKTAKAGDKLSLHLARDLVVKGKAVMPRGTQLSATVTDAKNGNEVSVVLEKAIPRTGTEVALMGIIAAVAAPPLDISSDPLYSMKASSEATQRTGNSSVTSLASSGAAAQTAMIKGENDPKSNLREDSSGTIGIEGLTLNWSLIKPPATTVLTAKKKNFKLAKGMEIPLRMAPPQM